MIKQELADNIKFHFDARKGSLLDQSGEGLTMSVAAGEPLWQNTDRGKAMSFDGVSDYLENATANWRSSDSSGTFSAWIRFKDVSATSYAFASCDEASASRYFGFGLLTSKMFVTQNESAATNVTGSTTLKENVWYHLTITSTGTAYQLYLNGVRETESTPAGTNNGDWLAETPNRDNVTIGALHFSSVAEGNVDVREILYFDTPLTAAQTAQLYSESVQEAFTLGLPKTNFQIPPLFGGEENLGDTVLVDGDMEASGVSDWTVLDSTLTKETGTRTGGSGTQVLRVTMAAATYWATQGISITGKTYRITGWARSNGVDSPQVFMDAANRWYGTSSTDWQYFDFTSLSTAGAFYVGSGDATVGAYVEFDDVKVQEIQNVGSWNMKLNDGLVVDNSVGGNDLTQTGGSVTSVPGVGGEAIKPDGSSSYLKKTVANYRSGDTAGSIEGWVTVVASASSKTVFCSADEATTNYYLLLYANNNEQVFIQTKDGSTVDSILGDTILPDGADVYIRAVSDGTAWKLYLNNTEDTPYSVTGTNNGNWFADILNRDSIVVGSLLRTSAANFHDGTVDGLLISSQLQTDAEYERRYLKGAKKLTYYNDFSDVPVTLGTSSVDLGDFNASSGTWKISQDSDKQKWLECVTAGMAYIETPQAYGTWEFDLYKKLDANNLIVQFVANEIDAYASTSQTGYNVALSTSEHVVLGESTGAGPTNLGVSQTSYITIQTKYTVRVTRSPAGIFTYYIKGGTFTNWTLVDASLAGSNPVTDTTNTTNRYFILEFDVGDKISNIKFMLGDVTPTQVP